MFLVAEGALDDVRPGAQVTVDGDEGRHAVTVRRLSAGERVDLADGRGVLARGVVSAAGAGVLRVQVSSLRQQPPPRPRFVLAQALAKGDRDLQAVEAATELGVDEVVPWQAARSVVRWRGERAARSHRRWEQTVRAAAKQSRRSWVPVVATVVDTGGLVARVASAGLAVVLDAGADQPLGGTVLPEDQDVLVVVGPEGGVEPSEVADLLEAGAVARRLGPSVLRSSTAGPAALAVLAAQVRWR
ncbi:MAG: 16S rRNA (uracil(1498)-N(3))-methyltransferase [Angustibacter sp.]